MQSPLRVHYDPEMDRKAAVKIMILFGAILFVGAILALVKSNETKPAFTSIQNEISESLPRPAMEDAVGEFMSCNADMNKGDKASFGQSETDNLGMMTVNSTFRNPRNTSTPRNASNIVPMEKGTENEEHSIAGTE